VGESDRDTDIDGAGDGEADGDTDTGAEDGDGDADGDGKPVRRGCVQAPRSSARTARSAAAGRRFMRGTLTSVGWWT
jgi:hypothetical protein